MRNRQRKRRLQQDWETLTVRLHRNAISKPRRHLRHLYPVWCCLAASMSRRPSCSTMPVQAFL